MCVLYADVYVGLDFPANLDSKTVRECPVNVKIFQKTMEFSISIIILQCTFCHKSVMEKKWNVIFGVLVRKTVQLSTNNSFLMIKFYIWHLYNYLQKNFCFFVSKCANIDHKLWNIYRRFLVTQDILSLEMLPVTFSVCFKHKCFLTLPGSALGADFREKISPGDGFPVFRGDWRPEMDWTSVDDCLRFSTRLPLLLMWWAALLSDHLTRQHLQTNVNICLYYKITHK